MLQRLKTLATEESQVICQGDLGERWGQQWRLQSVFKGLRSELWGRKGRMKVTPLRMLVVKGKKEIGMIHGSHI